MISFSPHNHQMRVVLLLSPFYSGRKGDTRGGARPEGLCPIPTPFQPCSIPLADITRRLHVSPSKKPWEIQSYKGTLG